MNLRPGLLRKFVILVCFVAPALGLLTAAAARPDPATLIHFLARPAHDKITVEWATATELDTAAFSLHRAESPSPPDWGAPIYEVAAGGSLSGVAYSYIDSAVTPGVVYYYLLRDLSTTGVVTDHGTVSASAAFSCADVTQLPRAECEALVALYQKTNGPGWTHRDGWLATTTPCSWHGVTCRSGHVRALNLDCNQLSGELPPGLRDLARLEALSIAGGASVFLESGRVELVECAGARLGGLIPPELGQLAYLERLDLALNDLTGAIPSQLGNLIDLRVLALGGNRLSGPVPWELGQLSDLERLDLTANELTGPVPIGQGFLYSLERLDLRGNRFDGEIPAELGVLGNLRYVDLSDNRLRGGVPAFGSLRKLLRLSLSDNRLSGGVPAGVAAPNLERLDLSDNPLTGPLPRSLLRLNLSELAYAGTGVCAPPDPAYQAWLAAIPDVQPSGVACAQARLPLVYRSVAAPTIFWSDRHFLPPNGCATLRWNVTDAVAVWLDGVGVTGQGSRQVCPARTTTYVLKVVWANGAEIDYPLTITVTAEPWVGVDGEGNFYRGYPGAVVKMEAFMDFECPFCARHALETGPQIDAAYVTKGEVVEIFRNFPLDFHSNAEAAAAAAFCAGQQDPAQFWALRDWLFAHQSAWSGQPDAPAQFRSAALEYGVDAAKYDACIASPAPAARIERDLKEGSARGVRGVPAFFLNDWPISGAMPYEVFAGAIENVKRGLPPMPVPTRAPPAPPPSPTRMPTVAPPVPTPAYTAAPAATAPPPTPTPPG